MQARLTRQPRRRRRHGLLTLPRFKSTLGRSHSLQNIINVIGTPPKRLHSDNAGTMLQDSRSFYASHNINHTTIPPTNTTALKAERPRRAKKMARVIMIASSTPILLGIAINRKPDQEHNASQTKQPQLNGSLSQGQTRLHPSFLLAASPTSISHWSRKRYEDTSIRSYHNLRSLHGHGHNEWREQTPRPE